MGTQIVTWVSSFALMLFLPRFLGSEEFGRLFLAISITMICQQILEFGGTYYITKAVARDKDSTANIFVNSVALRSFFWVISLIITFGLAFIAGYPPSVKMLLLILTISKVWEGALGVMQRCYQGHEAMSYSSVGNLTEKVFIAVAGIGALLLGARSVTIAILMAASTLLNFFVCLHFLPKIISFFPRIDFSSIKRIARESVPYFLWTLFGVIYYRVDAVMLSLMVPTAVVGWYGAAYRFFDILMFLPSIFTSAIFPIFSKLWVNKNEALSLTTQKSLDFMLIAGIPVSIACFTSSEHIISLFFGLPEFNSAIVLLKIFSLGLLIVYSNFILISVIVASDHQKHWLKIAFIAMLLNPLLNALLIPYFQTKTGNGGIGSAIATLMTEYFLLIMAVSIMPKIVFAQSRVRVILKGFTAGLGMAATLWILFTLHLNWIVNNVIALGVYICSLLVLKTFEQSELLFIRNYLLFWKRKPSSEISVETR